MSNPIERALALLRDVPGIEGSFLVDVTGTLVARDAAMGLPEWLLAGAATRLATLVESSEDAFEAPRELALVFGDRSMVVRVSAPYLLALLVTPAASMEAVRLASNAALRQVVRALATVTSTPLPPPTPPRSDQDPLVPAASSTQSSALSPLASVTNPSSVTLKSGPALKSSGPASSSAAKQVATPGATAAKKKKSDIWG
jgi:predicted regulator of Ras-like GTPase activity (Roadblock/LC7/MglB family)